MYQTHKAFEDLPPAAVLDSDIAIVGMAGRFAGARDIDAYWRNLRDGIESIVAVSDDELIAAGVSAALIRNPDYVKASASLDDVEMFDAGFFGLSPREGSIMDPQHRMFLECSWAALENAAHVPARFPGAIGVFGGCGAGTYLRQNLLTNPRLVESVGMFLLRHTGNDKDFLTTRVSYLLDLKGPSVSVQTACSTSLVAIHMAIQSLLNRECDMALAGGATVELPGRQGYLYQEGDINAPDGHCRAFDASAKGTVFGSGAGVVVLRRLVDALADGDHVHAVIKGSAINNDGAGKVGYLAPSVDGQAQAISEALTLADVPADTITYVEAHGTGTPVGDPIEVAALTQAFRRTTDRTGFCALGSVKGNIGHTDTAAGIAGVLKVALAMQHHQLPPTLHYSKPNPMCAFERSPFVVNAALSAWTPPAGLPRRAGVSSLGVGGTNAHVVMEEAPRTSRSPSPRTSHLLVISAKTATALDANTAALGAYLAANPDAHLADVAYTLQLGRQPMRHRRTVAVTGCDDAVAVLCGPAGKRAAVSEAPEQPREAVFMFAGGGAQYTNMGLGLYDTQPVFRDAVDVCLGTLQRRCGLDVRPWLFPEPGTEVDAARALERPSVGLPALFTIQYAQAKLWLAWGIVPRAMIGHSLGEYVAAHLAGVFDLDDALAAVALRGRLFDSLPAGRMLSVSLGEAELRAILPDTLSIAAINGPAMTVASGPVDAIAALQAHLDAREIANAPIAIDIAAHSAMLAPILAEFGAYFRAIVMREPARPFISSLTGTWITPAEAVDPNYWVRQMRGTVRFADGVAELLKDPACLLLEVGPGKTLSSLARHHPVRTPAQPVLNSLRHPDEVVSDTVHGLDILGRLWAAGVTVDWTATWAGERRHRLPLPTYRFDRQRCWIEPGQAVVTTTDANDDDDLPRNEIDDWFYQPIWHRSDRPAAIVATVQATTLVFEDDCGLGAALAEDLAAQGRDVVRVRAGRRFAWSGRSMVTINPALPGDYETLVARLAEEGRSIGTVHHLWMVTGDARRPLSIDGAEALQQRGFYSLLFFAQAIGREDMNAAITVSVVSDHMQRIATETGLVAAKATVLGACKVLPREYPNLVLRSIDVIVPVAGTREARALLAAIVAETDAPDGADVIAWRGAERWVQRFVPVRLAPEPSAVRPRGVYLITGGLGGIGLTLARHLAEMESARLVLVGRGGLPAREDWAARLADFDADDGEAERIRQVMAIEALGGEVLVVAGDVTNPFQMRHAVQQARARFGAIDGVFHTAGVIDDGIAQTKEAHAAAAVLAPKLRGTLVLDEALANERPAFIVLFSSVSATIGLAGQVDYAAANAFLDAFAQSRTGQGGVRVIAVDWSQWQEVGMAAALAQQLGVVPTRTGVARPAGHPLLGDCLRETPTERVFEARLGASTHWVLDEHRVEGGQALVPGTGFLEIVRAGMPSDPASRPIEIADLVFLAPFGVDDDAQRLLRLRLERPTGGGWQFVISGRSPAGDDGVDHVRGAVAHVDALRPAAIETASIRARCRFRSHIGDLPPNHMQFGPRWRNVVRADYGEAEALLQLELPASFAGDLETMALHPALMDFATAGAQSLVPGFDSSRDFYVPASYGRVCIFAPLPARLASHIRYRGDAASDGDVATYDVTIMDDRGHVLVEIVDFTMMRVPAASLLASGTVSAKPARARTSTPANDILIQGQRNAICPGEGMAALDRILGAGTGAQIVVSPQPFVALAARLRRPRFAPAGQAGKDRDDGGAPRTGAEILVAELWRELLGMDSVGLNDDFFDCGGHSLLAVQLINRLKRRTGTALPLTVLLEYPTVGALAALIEPPAGTDAPSGTAPEVAAAPARASVADAICIRPGSTRPPIFFVHDGLGETLLYRTLALKLGNGRAVYGLQPQRRPDGSFVHTGIKDMAAGHLASVRAVQPQGPYLFAGLCAGGVVAFEMGLQLEGMGEEVRFIGIIDAADTQATPRRFYVARARLSRLAVSLGGDAGESATARLAAALPRLARKAANFVAYELSLRIENMRAARTFDRRQRRGDADDAPEANGDMPSFLKMYQLAHRRHQPRGLFSGGDVVLFKATKGNGSGDDAPFSEQFSDRALGWGKRVADDVAVIMIPGGHSSALQNPNVATLARAIDQCITAALLKRPTDIADTARRLAAELESGASEEPLPQRATV